MSTKALFIFQFAWFLVAWSVVAYALVIPATRHLATERRLQLWLAPQMFRVLGVGLLVSNISPGMPRSFALPTAAMDTTTAVLAVLAVFALQRGRGSARVLAWACTLVGCLDLLIALPHAARVDAFQYLHAQWYVPTLGVPLMIVCHVMAFRVLRERQTS